LRVDTELRNGLGVFVIQAASPVIGAKIHTFGANPAMINPMKSNQNLAHRPGRFLRSMAIDLMMRPSERRHQSLPPSGDLERGPRPTEKEFSHAYVQAIAAVAGVAWSIPSVDDDSVDISLHKRGGNGSIRSPRLDLQLKCKATQSPSEAEFSHSLKIKNYDDLRDPFVQIPRLLVVVLVPDDLTDWLCCSESELVMRRCGYWLNLRGLPASGNATSQTVQLKRSQIFDPQSLCGIFARIANREHP
jgi:hypothetical protein